MTKRKTKEPSLVDFSLLKLAGFSEVQIHIMHYLQQGFSIADIAHVIRKTRGDVNYHLDRIAKKLRCSGKAAEIMARAIITTYEIAVKKGLKKLPLM
jgi:DNA-binding NarL/FixJ family response regulator